QGVSSAANPAISAIHRNEKIPSLPNPMPEIVPPVAVSCSDSEAATCSSESPDPSSPDLPPDTASSPSSGDSSNPRKGSSAVPLTVTDWVIDLVLGGRQDLSSHTW